MTKLSRRPLPKDFGFYVNNLWAAFTVLQSKADIRILFKDIFTDTEYKMFAKRLEVARRLLEGSTYESICKELAVTNSMIGTVSEVLHTRGGGYRKVHARLSEFEEKRRKREARRLDTMSNPFKRKLRRKTALGTLLKAGIQASDKAVIKAIKNKSAAQQLPL